VERLLDFASGNRIVVPVFRRRQGHPVHFGESFRRELAQLEGDFGARAILDRHPEAVTEVEVDDQGVIVDVDTEADLTSVAMLTDERK
jgi:molybdenum cofactor cytidylyltransferase